MTCPLMLSEYYWTISAVNPVSVLSNSQNTSRQVSGHIFLGTATFRKISRRPKPKTPRIAYPSSLNHQSLLKPYPTWNRGSDAWQRRHICWIRGSLAWQVTRVTHFISRCEHGWTVSETIRYLFSVVSIAESEYGLNLNPLPADIQQNIRNMMASYQVLPIDHHTARIYGRIRATLFNAYAPRGQSQ